MSDLLLTAKFYIPREREGKVPRPRLAEKVLLGISRPASLVVVSGPAGFGKTTVLIEAAARCPVPLSWLSLDERDNDPIRFWTYVIAACQRAHPGLGESALSVFMGPAPAQPEVIPDLLLEDFNRLGAELVLVLDDFHLIQNPEIHPSIAYLVEHQPANFHLVVSTRVDPPWPLARLRARNRLVEIRAAQLRFSLEESAAFLNQSMRLSLPPEEVAALETRTEGWVTGLQLAAISLQSRSDSSSFIRSLAGSHLYIAEYLLEEVFRSQPAGLQSFLLATSILERMSAGVCEALTGCADGQSTLTTLLRNNLFITPLDDEGRWFRYHHLFADLLRARLKQSLPPQEIQALHDRAAGWFESAGMETEALDHAVAAQNYARALRIVERIALPMILQAHVRTVEGWLRAIPAAYIAENPRVNLACAWMYLLRGNGELAAPFLERLEGWFDGGEPPHDDPDLGGEWLALQAKRLNLQGKARESIACANQALGVLPAGNTDVRTLVTLELATAYQQLADYEQAAAIFQTIAREARARGDYIAELLGISARARMTLLQGKLHLTFQIAQEGLRRLEETGKFTPFSATLFGEVGQVCYLWHRLDEAQEYQRRSVQMSGRSGYLDPEMFYHVVRSRIFQMDEDWEGAQAEMQAVSELLRVSPPAMIRADILAQQARVDLAFERLPAVQAALEQEGFDLRGNPLAARGPAGSHPPFGMLFNCSLRYRLHLARIGRPGPDLGRLIEAAGQAFEDQLGAQQIPIALEALLLRAQMRSAGGDEPGSLADLARAVELACPEGFISVFAEEGPPVKNGLEALLRRGLLEPPSRSFLQEVLAAFPSQPAPARPETPEASHAQAFRQEGDRLLEPLTPREMEVLRLIATGDSNQAIAAKLVVTLSAVKKHTANIYAKLSVGSRTQAVALARRLGMLPE